MVYVLDASAMVALLRQEAGWEAVRDLLYDPNHACYAHALNLCEVFYDFHRDGGEAAAQLALERLLGAMIQPREDLDRAF